MMIRQPIMPVAAAVFLCLALSLPSWIAIARADDGAEIRRLTELLQAQQRAINALQEQNRAITQRLAELEAARQARAQQKQQEEAKSQEQQQLEQRVKELEVAKTAQETATRSIIRDAVSTLGSNINESVALGGTLELLTGWSEDFSGESEGVLLLNTAELDFEIQANDWTFGSLTLAYDDGTSTLFQTVGGAESGVDRITIDTAFLTIGDPQRFPLFGTGGQIILPFGTSTGDPVADVLTIADPLTIEVFEMQEVAIGVGLGFPTPALAPTPPPVTPPPVRPLVLKPLISSFVRLLGYRPPPTLPPALTPLTPTPVPPLFNVGIFSYNGTTFEGTDSGGYQPFEHLNATVGFRTQGTCGRYYDQLRKSLWCPWSIDIDVDFNTSVFDSPFLEDEYQPFLGQIGFVPGMAASVKATFGPISFVGEWNGAISAATFTDDADNALSIRPSAWQVSLGYQFDWNPWVEAIGAQGTYITFSYSESRDLAGAMRLINDDLSRIGSVPKRRLLVSVGEWILDNLKFAVEYSYAVDYPRRTGGTGRSANGVFTMMTIVW